MINRWDIACRSGPGDIVGVGACARVQSSSSSPTIPLLDHSQPPTLWRGSISRCSGEHTQSSTLVQHSHVATGDLEGHSIHWTITHKNKKTGLDTKTSSGIFTRTVVDALDRLVRLTHGYRHIPCADIAYDRRESSVHNI